MPRRRRSNAIRNILLTAFLVIFLFMGVFPLIEMRLPIGSGLASWLEWTRSRLMETLIAAWFFAFGSVVGSFINVVVWRMPRGVSVVSRGSACPYCTSKIRLKDNIPIFGWIKLGGRCRVCRLPISPRYPIVELMFGVVFLLMFFVELQTACGNLPGDNRHRISGILQVIISTKWGVIATYAYHMVLIVMLMTWSLMAFDRSRLPTKTVVFTVLAGFAGAAALPYLQPVKWIDGHSEWFNDLSWIKRIDTSFLGLTCGFLIGGLLEMLVEAEASNDSTGGQYLSVSLMSIGLFLGWQSVAAILLLFGVLMIARAMLTEQFAIIPAPGVLTLATILHLCLWRFIEGFSSWQELVPEWIVLCGCLLLGFSLVFAAQRIQNHSRNAESSDSVSTG